MGPPFKYCLGIQQRVFTTVNLIFINFARWGRNLHRGERKKAPLGKRFQETRLFDRKNSRSQKWRSF
jgi:hypothetical protein